MSKPLKKLMKKVIASDAQEELAVSDAKLGNVIKVMDKKLKVVFSTKKCFKKWLCLTISYCSICRKNSM